MQIYEVDYDSDPPFPDLVNDPLECEWCVGTGHPYGDDDYGICKCPGVDWKEFYKHYAGDR